MAQVMEAQVCNVCTFAQARPRFLKGPGFPPGEDSGTKLWRSGREGPCGQRVQWNLFWCSRDNPCLAGFFHQLYFSGDAYRHNAQERLG